MSNINKQALKPGKYAILFRNNWDGEGDTYDTLAILDDELVWRDEDGKELLEYDGDAVLKAWAMDDGSNLLALLDELEESERLRVKFQEANCELCQKLEAAERRVAKLSDARAKGVETLQGELIQARIRAEDAEKRIAELEAREVTLPEVEKWRSVDAVRAQNAYKVLVSKALADAGIRINREG